MIEDLGGPGERDRTGGAGTARGSDAYAMVVSYLAVRRAIGAIGLTLPIVLGPVGWLAFGVEIQPNMSGYYHTPLRDAFVGALCSIGVFLFCYRGRDRLEDWTANLGGLAALGLALFPIDAGTDPLHPRTIPGYLHTACGGMFFLSLAVYSLFHFPDSDRGEPAPHRAQRNLVYRASGLVILLSLAGMGADLFLAPEELRRRLDDYHFLFWGEWVAVWAFAAAWLTKGRAMLAEVAVDLLAWPAELLKGRK